MSPGLGTEEALKKGESDAPDKSMSRDQSVILFNCPKLMYLSSYCTHFYHSRAKNVSFFRVMEEVRRPF